jgi:hypothetical protein
MLRKLQFKSFARNAKWSQNARLLCRSLVYLDGNQHSSLQPRDVCLLSLNRTLAANSSTLDSVCGACPCAISYILISCPYRRAGPGAQLVRMIRHTSISSRVGENFKQTQPQFAHATFVSSSIVRGTEMHMWCHAIVAEAHATGSAL